MERNRLYGIGEPLTMRVLKGEIDREKALDIMDEIGVTAMREWMLLDSILKDPGTPDREICDTYKATLDRCVELDIEVTGMGSWYLPNEFGWNDFSARTSMPERDRSKESRYSNVLKQTEEAWETMAAQFPQINQWEVGNEWNFPLFLHPYGWEPGKPSFTIEEAMLIACDLMYVSAKGIRKGNPKAKVVSFSPTPDASHFYLPAGVPETFGIPVALDIVYNIIESGRSYSQNADDYFDMLAWHPYLSSQMGYAPIREQYPAEEQYRPDELPDALWKSYNDQAYNVMASHGDGHKKVLITEFGFSDACDPERQLFQAGLIPDVFRLLKQMPYIKTCHFFRLFEAELDNPESNGVFTNASESKFGIIREPHNDYAWREKAKVLQTIYKAT